MPEVAKKHISKFGSPSAVVGASDHEEDG